MDYKYYVSLVLLIRDENRYLVEWLDFHIKDQEFDHIYIYDNGVEESVIDIIPEELLEYITIIDWHPKSGRLQQDAYNHWLEYYGNESQWVDFIDSDEFIYSMRKDKSIKDYLKENEKYPLIFVGATFYNANGLRYYEDKPVRERFTKIHAQDNSYHKDLVQTKYITEMYRHFPRLVETGEETLKQDKFININHYYTKSWEEWCWKIKVRGTCDKYFKKRLHSFFEYNRDMRYLKDELLDTVQDYNP